MYSQSPNHSSRGWSRRRNSPPNNSRQHISRSPSPRHSSARPSGRVSRRSSKRRANPRMVAAARAWAIDMQTRTDPTILTADDIPPPTVEGEAPVWTEMQDFLDQLDEERYVAPDCSTNATLPPSTNCTVVTTQDEPAWMVELNEFMEEIRNWVPGQDTKSQVSTVTKCVICLDEMKGESQDTTTLHCGHSFDTICINSWATSKLTERKPAGCPFCRKVFMPLPQIPHAVIDGLLGIDVHDVSTALTRQWHARRHNYWRQGADDATLTYIDECFLRHRADWLAAIGNGRPVYDSIRWLLGRPPRNADLISFLGHWEDAVVEQESLDPLAAVSLDYKFIEGCLNSYLDILPDVERQLRESRYL